MRQKDGKEWLGKFIRKNDPILEFISVSSFNLKEISVHPTAVPDNASNTIIHQRLHDPDEFKDAISPSFLTKNEFEPEGGRRPVLVPLDFTKDWEMMKKRINKRQSRFDEDDDDLEIYEAMQASREEAARKKAERHKPKGDRAEASEKKAETTEGEELKAAPATEAAEPEDRPILSINREKAALDSIAKSLPGEENPLGAGIAPEQSPRTFRSKPEAAMDKPPAPQEKSPPVDTSAIEKEAYEQGFERGMTDALHEVQKDYDEKSKVLAHLMAEIEGLKKDILHNAQDNFQKICASMMEAILKREYRLNPETFNQVMGRAIEETVENDQFRILMHSDQIKALEAVVDSTMKGKIFADDSIAMGDFKIETSHKVVDGKTGKLIQDLLDQANIDLFVDEEAS